MDKLVGPWLAAVYGATNGGWFGLTHENMDLLKTRLGKGQPTQLVITDRSGCDVRVEPTRHDALLVVTNERGEIIVDMNQMLIESIRAHW